MQLINKITNFSIRRKVRHNALRWWDSLTLKERADIADGFFGPSKKEVVKDADIEEMYLDWVID